MAVVILISFKTPATNALKHIASKATMLQKEAITFFAHQYVVLADGTTYTGTVNTTGAFNKTGTNIMFTQVLGMALHCTFVATFPDGTLTIRMNCNMKTFKGQWQILEGAGTYENTKGQGSLVMPNDVDEILTGVIHQ